MEERQHRGQTLKYLTLEPDGYDVDRSYPVVILLHGFGASMGDLARLCPAIDREAYVYVCPSAPTPIKVGVGLVGYSWTTSGADVTPEDGNAAEEMLSTLFEEVMELYPGKPENMVLGGFSQGGMIAYRCGLTRPDVFRGLVALSSRLSDPEVLRPRLPSTRDQAIFIAHGSDDTMIPVEDSRESVRFLKAQGYAPQYKEYPMGHEIIQEVLDDLVPWMREVLPPVR